MAVLCTWFQGQAFPECSVILAVTHQETVWPNARGFQEQIAQEIIATGLQDGAYRKASQFVDFKAKEVWSFMFNDLTSNR